MIDDPAVCAPNPIDLRSCRTHDQQVTPLALDFASARHVREHVPRRVLPWTGAEPEVGVEARYSRVHRDITPALA